MSGLYYFKLLNTPVNWDNARLACRDLHYLARPVSIQSAAKNIIVVNFIKNQTSQSEHGMALSLFHLASINRPCRRPSLRKRRYINSWFRTYYLLTSFWTAFQLFLIEMRHLCDDHFESGYIGFGGRSFTRRTKGTSQTNDKPRSRIARFGLIIRRV